MRVEKGFAESYPFSRAASVRRWSSKSVGAPWSVGHLGPNGVYGPFNLGRITPGSWNRTHSRNPMSRVRSSRDRRRISAARTRIPRKPVRAAVEEDRRPSSARSLARGVLSSTDATPLIIDYNTVFTKEGRIWRAQIRWSSTAAPMLVERTTPQACFGRRARTHRHSMRRRSWCTRTRP